MVRRPLCVLSLALAAPIVSGAFAGCGGDDAAPEAAYEAEVAWGGCQEPFQHMDECGTFEAPLDWGAPSGEKISVFLARKRASGAPRAQLWLLQGGPGGSGAVFSVRYGGAPSEVERLAEALPDVDIYVLEHRGVGRSTFFTCPKPPLSARDRSVNFGECIGALKSRWLGRTQHFSSTAAARDLAAATDATRAGGQALFVYGVSYGTYWAAQYLRERPADAAGVILDSVAPPGRLFFNDFGTQNDAVVEKLAGLCAQDALCRQKMGPDPFARVKAALDGVAQGRCLPELDVLANANGESFSGAADDYARRVKRTLAATIRFRETNTLLLPLLYRLERCEPADAAALFHYFSYFPEAGEGLAEGDDPAARLSSRMLRFHIGGSELYAPDAPPLAELERTCEGSLLCADVTSDAYLRELWPLYTPPPTVREWPATAVPILAMNGDLDPQTPVEKAALVEPDLAAPTQRFVRVPYAPHGVLISSPLGSDPNETCGRKMVVGFVRDPAAPDVASCVDDLLPPSFAVGDAAPTYAAEDVQLFFGDEAIDLWENAPAAPPPPPAALAPRATALRERLARAKSLAPDFGQP